VTYNKYRAENDLLWGDL